MRDVTVVGASLAGLSAVRALRAQGFEGRIVVVGEEKHRPYDRPPLSKDFLAGTTGEADALDDSERVKLVEAVRAAVDVPVIAGASGAWVGQATERVRAVVAAGADAVLVAPPRRCTDPRPFYEKVAEAAGSVPVLAYHFPGVAGGEVPVELLPDLPVAGLKDSSGDVERLLRELSVWEGWTYVGSSALTASAGLLGATGALLAVANAVPELAVAAFGSPAPPDGEAQRALLSACSPITSASISPKKSFITMMVCRHSARLTH